MLANVQVLIAMAALAESAPTERVQRLELDDRLEQRLEREEERSER